MVKDWDWDGQEERQCTAVHSVASTAVYTNQSAEIVIRQRFGTEEGDATIILSVAAAKALIEALNRELESPFTPG